MLYDAAVELAPAGMTFTEADLRSLPLYDDDVRLEQDYPEPARRLRADIAAADGLLIVSPEYNHTVPGRAAERHRLGVAPAGPAVQGQAGGDHGRVDGPAGDGQDAARPADHASSPSRRTRCSSPR